MAATDREIMAEIGGRLEALRKARRLTMVKTAEQAGISRRTLYRAEEGENPTLLTLIRILRVYGRLGALEGFIPEPEVSPLDYVRERREHRERYGD
jgi:transcriptional regulator with XRE-family HTH domain